MSKSPRDSKSPGKTGPGAVGYKNPPADKRFKAGKSGNPRGRPKGHRNVATMTKDVLSRRVKVRSEGKTVEMRAVEAIFRVLANGAAQGNIKAASLFNRLRDMAGLGSDLTEEELQKHVMRLPRGFSSPEEMDLCWAPAREKDRQRYLAMAELDETSPDPETRASNAQIPPSIKAGDRLAAHRDFAKALEAYRSQIILCKEELTADASNKTAQYNFRRTVARMGLIANAHLYEGAFANALAVANEAITEGTSDFWVLPETITHPYHNIIWIRTIRALAFMFLESLTGESAQFFRSFETDKRLAYTSCEYSILREFVHLRRTGYSHPTMDEIEGHLSATGWVRDTTEDRPGGAGCNFPHFAEVTLGEAHAAQGELDEAVAVFRSILATSNADLMNHAVDRSAHAERHFVAARIGCLARTFLLAKQFKAALDCANEALEHDPHSTSLTLDRAHALMFLGITDEARTIYLNYHGKRMSGRRWVKDAIQEDFVEMRKASLSHNLMEEIERQFTEIQWGKRLSGIAGGNGRSTISRDGDRSSTPAPSVRSRAINAQPPPRSLSERDDMEAGYELLTEFKPDEAVTVFKRCIERCDRTLANGNQNMQLRDERRGSVEGIIQAAFLYTLATQYEKARSSVEFALSKVPNLPFANIRRAHVHMLSEETHDCDQLRSFYLEQPEAKVTAELRRRELILQDFKEMREYGRVHPLMVEIETILSQPKLDPQQ